MPFLRPDVRGSAAAFRRTRLPAAERRKGPDIRPMAHQIGTSVDCRRLVQKNRALLLAVNADDDFACIENCRKQASGKAAGRRE